MHDLQFITKARANAFGTQLVHCGKASHFHVFGRVIRNADKSTDVCFVVVAYDHGKRIDAGKALSVA